MKNDNPTIPLSDPCAFPVNIPVDNGAIYFDPGMTLRDYFAGQLIAKMAERRFLGLGDDRNRFGVQEVPELAAKDAYMIADAMLTERSKEARP